MNMEQLQVEKNIVDRTQDQQAAEPKQTKLIIVTGFGPFVGHEDVNASWEAVRLLPDILHYKDTQYVLDKQMLDVKYAAVDKAIEEIWARKPEFVLHCGVHGLASCLHVEKFAYNHKFKRRDYAGKRLRNGSACLVNCKEGIGNDVICCGLNVDKIVRVIKDSCDCTPTTNDATDENVEMAKVSQDVGNYLCGYIYLKSLDMNCNRSLFVHVPRIDKPFSSSQTSKVILKIIEECVRQIREDMQDTC